MTPAELIAELKHSLAECHGIILRMAQITENTWKTPGVLNGLRVNAQRAHEKMQAALALPVPESGAIPLNQRLFDLVRYCRHELHQKGLVTDEEFAQLCTNGSARNLESYAQLRARIAEQDAQLEQMQKNVDTVASVANETNKRKDARIAELELLVGGTTFHEDHPGVLRKKIAELERDLATEREIWVDEDTGVSWTRPAAWAYAAICKAHQKCALREADKR